MNSEPKIAARHFKRRWILATTLGWLLGFVLIVLFALILDTVGVSAQFIVGLGMGAGVGFLQARELRLRLNSTWSWFWASTIGMGLPFLIWDIATTLGIGNYLSLPPCVLLGSLFVGVLQYRLLRQADTAIRWIPHSIVGWGLPAGIIWLADAGLFPGRWKLLTVIPMLLGGLVLGVVTWFAIRGFYREVPTQSVSSDK